MRTFACIGWLLLVVCFPNSIAAQQPDPGGVRIAEADELMTQHHYEEALAKYREALRLAPDRTVALYNGGLAAYQAGHPDQAAELWDRLSCKDTADIGVRIKLVQAWQAAGRLDRRDRARQEVLDLHAQQSAAERARKPRFCRDQFVVGAVRVMAFEYFELTGARPVRYRFSILNEEGGEADFLTLGSFPEITAAAREDGAVGPRDQAFHLDGSFGTEYRNYSLAATEPSYDDCRKKVEAILILRAAGVEGPGESK